MTRRWLGGVFGNTVGSDTPASSTTGVFSIEQQYYIMAEGGWLPPAASGGNQEITFGSYTLQVFTSPGTLTIARATSFDIFLIGGGGAGGAAYGNNDVGKGGGGAGQALWRTSVPLGVGTHAITVGNGGAGRGPESGNNQVGQGAHGSSSSIVLPGSFGGTVTALGGFGGAGSDCYGPYTTTGYGCGGGGGSRNPGCSGRQSGIPSGGNSYSGWTSYANGGGDGNNGNTSGGGGGGCGGGGSNQSGGPNDPNSQAGAGGVGVDMSPVFGTSVGDSGYFGGGGGGGTYCYGGPIAYRAAGGQGGGGKGTTAQENSQGGASDASGIDGQANTGGGGGGASEGDSNPGSNSGSGGSGIVIVRYQ
jgi:hypothetical protein